MPQSYSSSEIALNLDKKKKEHYSHAQTARAAAANTPPSTSRVFDENNGACFACYGLFFFFSLSAPIAARMSRVSGGSHCRVFVRPDM
jgi:hypothetical protein